MYSCLSLRLKKRPWWKRLTSKIHSKLNKKSKNRHNRIAVVVADRTTKKTANKFSLNPRLRRRHTKRHQALLAGLFPFKKRRKMDFGLNVLDQTTIVASENTNYDNVGVVAEDVEWESIGIASPLMNGIDVRAEEFITNFRADMEAQEMLARGS